ncbi:MAG: TonB-dependent receptor [Phenylobacterium sp.]
MSLIPLAGVARAQDAVAADTEAALEEVVVTGSRIVRAGYTAPTPVTVMNTDELSKKAPSNIPDALNQLPQFAGSISQNAQADTGASKVRSGNYLDIRALGSQRVLILEDGRRVPPTSSNGATDANLIPQLLVERVDVVTGGASAAYGSDAVSGVVNFIIDKAFTGVKAVAQSGVSTQGDDASYKLGVAAGTTLQDGRLHLLGSAEYYHSDGVTDRSSRYTSSGENTDSAVTTGGFGTAAQPYFYIGNAHNNASAYGGYILGGPLVGRQFNPDGSVATFTPGTAIVGRPGYGIGGDGVVNVSKDRTGIPTLTTQQLFGRIAYDVTPDVSVFGQVSYNTGLNKDTNATPGTPGAGAPIFRDNAYLRPEVLAQLGTAASFNIARPFAEWSLNDQRQKSRSTIATLGLDATVKGARTHLYYIHGDTEFRTDSLNIDNRKFFAAIDAVRNPAGQIVCRITVTNPGVMDGCTPLNILGVGNASPAAQAFVRDYSIWEATNKLDLVAGDISGEPFSLWAGPVSVAVGAEYRHQSLVQTSNSDPALPVDFTGIRGVNTTNRFAGVNVGVADGSYSVTEVFGEVAVPLLKDSAVGDLDLNGAARYTHYSTSGAVTTWKVGASYKPIPDIRIRATISRDIRAPSLFELFAGKQQTTSPLTDLHTGLSRSTNVISSGNPDLTPEVADTYTVGAVFSPQAWPGFNASIDYYNIEINDAIAQPFTYIQMADLCEASNGTSELCAQIIRPGPFSDRSAANYPTEIRLQNLNLASVKTSGVDFEASWRGDLLDGAVGVRLLGTHLIDYIQQNSAQSPARQYAGNADFIQGFYPLPMPKWRGNLELSYARGPFSAGLQERYVGEVKKSDQFQHVENKLKATFYTDLNLTYAREVMGAKTDFYLTVNNVFDQKGRLFLISPVPGLNIPTSRNVYDIIGRYFTVGVKTRF